MLLLPLNRPPLPWLLLAVSITGFGAGHLLMLGAGMAHVPHRLWPDVLIAAAFLCYAVVGAAVASRHPGNPVGWVMLAMGLVYQLRAVAVGYTAAALLDPVASVISAESIGWLANTWIISFVLLATLGVLFPTGRLPSPRWRVFVWLAALVIVLGLVTASFELDGRILSFPGTAELASTPTGLEIVDTAGGIAQFGLLGLVFASVVALGRRLRRAGGVERQQLKWFVYALAAMLIVLILTTVAFMLPEGLKVDPAAPYPAGLWLGIPTGLAMALPPVAAGIAILRYRLFDIDLVINRTLVYGALTLTLGGVYVVLVIGLQGMLSGFTGGGSLAVAASTLAVAAVFQPVRRWIQQAVDRRFYRSRYDAARTLESLTTRLRDEVDEGRLLDEVTAVVEETLQPASTSIWLRRV
ncbi:MAG: hypothetical protein ACRDJ9_22935 [Dehalococcoidia bacterium]